MTSVDPPIVLKTKLPDILPTVQLERSVNVGGNQVRRLAQCPLINNEIEPELACKVYEEFQDICTQPHFHLDDGPLKFEYFRQCLAGQARAHWDVAVAAQANDDNAAFAAAIVAWFGNYFEPTSFHDQKQYFLQATKAFSMNVKETATRVEEIIRYMAFMPGAVNPVYSDVEKKMVLYRLMRANWKTNFDASGNVITDAGYTWNNLVTYMSAQEKKENKNMPGRFNQGPGRGSPQGGRGFGRGFGGRGYGRGRGRGFQGRGGYNNRRSMTYQGGPPSQRFRPDGYGQGGRGYAPAPYGSGYGYGYGSYGRGYGQGQGGGYAGNAYHGGRGGRFGGGRFQPRGREAQALANDPGRAHRNARETRSGQAYVTDGNEPSSDPGQSFDSGETAPTNQGNEHYMEEMYYGEGENGGNFDGDYDPYGGMDYGYGEEYGGYGDY